MVVASTFQVKIEILEIVIFLCCTTCQHLQDHIIVFICEVILVKPTAAGLYLAWITLLT
jgi:hypothetical protein